MSLRPSSVLGFTALALLAALPLKAQPAAPELEAFTLANGLEVVLVEDRSAPVVAVDVWYHVGSANDPEGRSGFAHLFEHMMFQGTANLSKDALQRLITDAGGRLNAYTGRDFTVYYEYLPSHQLPLALWLEADRMASLAVTQTNLDNQRAVVIQEYQQNYGGTPYGAGILELLTAPIDYGPYRRAPIGSVEDLNRATIEEVRDFHATYYVPNNATLVIAGDFDRDEARALVELYFGTIPAGDQPPDLPEWVPEQQAEPLVMTVQDDLIRIPAVLVGYEVPPRSDRDNAVLQVIDYLLTAGDSSRFRQRLVDTGEALTASTMSSNNLGPGFLGFILLPGPNGSRDELEQLFYAEIDLLIEEGVPQAELDKAINFLRLGEVLQLETAFGLAEQVQIANAHYGDPAAYLGELDIYRSVTPEDVQRVAAEYLAPADRHIVYVDPSEPVPTDSPVPFVGAVGDETDDAFDVAFALPFTEPPEPLAIRTFELPNITETTLDNGLEVVVIEAPELPIISVDLVIKGGASQVPHELSGMASALTELLTRGTTTRSAAEIADAIEGRGGGTRSGATADILSVGVFMLVDDPAFTFDQLADLVLNPTFPEEELALWQGQLTTAIDGALSDPGAQAARAFGPAVYGDHPYGGMMTPETIAAIDRQTMIEFYESVATPENAVLIVAGQIGAEEALALAQESFGEWQPTGAAEPTAFGPIDPLTGGHEIVLIDVPGAELAQVIIGNVALRGNDPARYPLSVVNEIFGEGLQSRLGRVIREELGYAYSIGSDVFLPVDVGTFRIGTELRADTAGEAIAEILRLVDEIRTEPVGLDELEAVRGGMIGRFALNLESHQRFVNIVASYKSRGIPLDDIGAYPARIAATDPAALLDAANRFIQENLVIVVAGNAELLLPQLETIGPVRVVEPR